MIALPMSCAMLLPTGMLGPGASLLPGALVLPGTRLLLSPLLWWRPMLYRWMAGLPFRLHAWRLPFWFCRMAWGLFSLFPSFELVVLIRLLLLLRLGPWFLLFPRFRIGAGLLSFLLSF